MRAPYLSFGEIRVGFPEVVTSKLRPVGRETEHHPREDGAPYAVGEA